MLLLFTEWLISNRAAVKRKQRVA